MMRQRLSFILIAIAIFLIPVRLKAAEDPFTGVWTLVLSESTLPPPIPKSQFVRIKADAKHIHIREKVMTGDHASMEVSVAAKFDGQEYPVKGSPYADTVIYDRVDSHTIKGIAKKAGKIVSNETAVISEDGRAMTVTYNTTDRSGKMLTAIAVFRRP
ncbi:MAG: hypothetical protein PHX83_12420 [Acidobacteriia bacterium]|nr:hypothetical protein [Terriglobia bacterium]